MKVVVIGAGVGGLAAAIGLHRVGAEVQVLERRGGLPAEGSGLTLFGNGFTALDTIGAGDAVRAVCAAEAAGRIGGIRRPDGTWLMRTEVPADSPIRVVHRRDLSRALAGVLPPDSVRWSFAVDSVTDTGDRVIVEGADGSAVDADLVIAADGIDSAVRRSWPSDPRVIDAGYAAWRAVTDRPVDIGGSAGETWGTGLRFGYAPLRHGRVYWFAVVGTRHDTADPVEALGRFAGWHDPIGAILAATAPDAPFRLPIRALDRPAPTFVRGRTVLLGDAAHAMTPNLGQGANQALEDAATLSVLLRKVVDGPAALSEVLAHYSHLRRPRVAALTRQARLIGSVAHAPSPLVPLRDAVMRLIPADRAQRQADALQGWQPPR
ncbi:FAD-dependent monooxygenase [Millisia brevis]|uniref:FAD-dependent monooxygenase n=1 Tax=Millisia brevis TaxID=264148 RepID=UPI0009FF0CE1|nr:FAD-dependent monooxygenase [Millisia brevis]